MTFDSSKITRLSHRIILILDLSRKFDANTCNEKSLPVFVGNPRTLNDCVMVFHTKSIPVHSSYSVQEWQYDEDDNAYTLHQMHITIFFLILVLNYDLVKYY